MPEIIIPYRRRSWFKPFHASDKRWRFVCAHRRAGKSVAMINELIKRAVQNTRKYPVPRYAYIGPSFPQTKDLIWGYAKHYAGAIPGTKFREDDLSVTLPTGALINLYGGGMAYNRIRGLYLDGAVLDEYSLLNPDAFESVVRPALADYQGFAVLAGTPMGRDHFFDVKLKAEQRPDEWGSFVIPVTETEALHPDEVEEMRRDMTPNKFSREMLCDFEAPVEGSYYGDLINELEAKGQISGVPHQPGLPVITAWDLGIKDLMTIWFIQKVGREIHWIDYHQDSGKGIPHYLDLLRAKPYTYAGHIFPPDIKARELSTGLERWHVLVEHNVDFVVCPEHKPADQVQAVRRLLPISWFDKAKCKKGLDALKAFQVAPTTAELATVHNKPLHNWASHGATAAGHLAIGLDRVVGWSTPTMGIHGVPSLPLRRNVRGVI